MGFIALHSTVITVSGNVINLSKYAIFYRSLSPCFAVSGVVNRVYHPDCVSHSTVIMVSGRVIIFSGSLISFRCGEWDLITLIAFRILR